MLFPKTLRAAVLLLLPPLFSVPPLAGQEMTTAPDQVRLELEDVRRLAAVLRSIDADPVDDMAAALEGEYLNHASVGLRVWAERYGVTGATLAAAMAADPAPYADLDGLADSVLSREEELRAAFGKLKAMVPEAVFPPIWFFVGHDQAGGLTRREGVLIAVETIADRPGDVVPLVLHELAHFQQAMVQGEETYRRIYGPEQTLLALAIREGSADLIAELTTGRHTNEAAERYGLAHEAELWSQFRADMADREPGDWMFVRPANGEWPPDLGYWIGYRIALSYYDQAADKEQAIADILAVTDFDAFLEASGYSP